MDSDGLSVTYSSGRTGTSAPDLRLLHFNDVYHVEYATTTTFCDHILDCHFTDSFMLCRPSSSEPVGGVARFQSMINYYRDQSDHHLPTPLTFFSGDAFNPSIESTVTKGRHMVPFLNRIGTDVACVGVSVVIQPFANQREGLY